MTIAQVLKAVGSNNFIVLRERDNSTIGINCKILKTKTIRKILTEKHLNTKTRFYSYFPCNFMEYISEKVPFYSKHSN